MALKEFGDRWWLSSENVWLYGGWWNWVNGIAGIVNIFCMTAWWGIYSSKDQKDMLWPDMTWCYILAYDLWNFEYTYNCLPTHSWYCGLALLLAPTFANHFWSHHPGEVRRRRLFSCSGDPCSATWPSLRTTTLSAASTVRMRCAITMTVLPASSLERADCTLVSFSTSSDAVASSSSTMGAFSTARGQSRFAGAHRRKAWNRSRRSLCRTLAACG